MIMIIACIGVILEYQHLVLCKSFAFTNDNDYHAITFSRMILISGLVRCMYVFAMR